MQINLRAKIRNTTTALAVGVAAASVGLITGSAVSAATEAHARDEGRDVVADVADELGLSDAQEAALAVRSDAVGGFAEATVPSTSLRDSEQSIILRGSGTSCLMTTLEDGVIGTCADDAEARSNGLFIVHRDEGSTGFDVLAFQPNEALIVTGDGTNIAQFGQDQMTSFHLPEGTTSFSFADAAGNNVSKFDLPSNP